MLKALHQRAHMHEAGRCVQPRPLPLRLFQKGTHTPPPPTTTTTPLSLSLSLVHLHARSPSQHVSLHTHTHTHTYTHIHTQVLLKAIVEWVGPTLKLRFTMEGVVLSAYSCSKQAQQQQQQADHKYARQQESISISFQTLEYSVEEAVRLPLQLPKSVSLHADDSLSAADLHAGGVMSLPQEVLLLVFLYLKQR